MIGAATIKIVATLASELLNSQQEKQLATAFETRTAGGKQRRYSNADIAQLLRISELAELGMNLEGIRQVMALENQVIQLQKTVAQLQAQLERALENSHTKYGLVPLNQTAMIFGRNPRIFDEER